MPLESTDTITYMSLTIFTGVVSVYMNFTKADLSTDNLTPYITIDADGYYQIDDAGERAILHAKANAGELPTPVYRSGETYESMPGDHAEEMGYNNPCDPASRARVKAAREAKAALGTDSETTTDATTGKPTIEFTGDLVQSRRVVTSAALPIGHDIWVATYGDTRDAAGDGPGPNGATGYFYLDLSLESDDTPLDDNDVTTYEAHDNVRAFVAIMNGLKDLPRSVNDNDVVGGLELGDWNGRVFRFTSEMMGGGNATSVNIVGVNFGSAYGTQGFVQWQYKPWMLGQNDVNHSALATWIPQQTATLTDAKEPVEAAGHGVTIRAERVIFPSGNEIRERRGQLHIISPTDRFNIRLGSASGRIVDVTTLTEAATADRLATGLRSYYLENADQYLRTVYLPASGVDSNRAVRLPRPSAVLDANLTDLAIQFNNENDTHRLSIYDWNENLMFTLGRDRTATVDFSFDAAGLGRAQVHHLHPRLGIWQRGNAENPNLNISLDGQTYYIVSRGTQRFIDPDAFETTTATAIAQATPFGVDGVKMLHDGELNIRMSCAMNFEGSGSATGIYLQIMKHDGSSYSSAVRQLFRDSISEARSPYDDLTVERTFSVEAGDWFAYSMRMNGNSFALGNIDIHNVDHRLELSPHILVTES